MTTQNVKYIAMPNLDHPLGKRQAGKPEQAPFMILTPPEGAETPEGLEVSETLWLALEAMNWREAADRFGVALNHEHAQATGMAFHHRHSGRTIIFAATSRHQVVSAHVIHSGGTTKNLPTAEAIWQEVAGHVFWTRGREVFANPLEIGELGIIPGNPNRVLRVKARFWVDGVMRWQYEATLPDGTRDYSLPSTTPLAPCPVYRKRQIEAELAG